MKDFKETKRELRKGKTFKQIIKGVNRKDNTIIDWIFDQDGIIYLRLKGFSFPFISIIPATPLTEDYKKQIFESFKRREVH